MGRKGSIGKPPGDASQKGEHTSLRDKYSQAGTKRGGGWGESFSRGAATGKEHWFPPQKKTGGVKGFREIVDGGSAP